MRRSPALICTLLCGLLYVALLRPASAHASGASTMAVLLQGLRSANHKGSFKAGVSLPDGSLVLLYDQGDGVRLLKTDPTATAVLAEAQQGTAGDSGVALVSDGAGNLYIGGTSTSGLLAGSSGSAFPAPVDASTNSFVAKFDSNLHLEFLSFLGASHTALTALAATADAVFVTGVTFSSNFPVTADAFQTTPFPNERGCAFVARFTSDGTSLRYATFLNADDGETTPVALAADAADNVYIGGSTSASTFPTLSPLDPVLFGSQSGFLAKVAPDGGSLLFSTFIAGDGLSSLALDPTSNTLLLTGNVAPGQFPIAHASGPLTNTPYQTLLRLSLDGQNLLDAVLLLPSTQSAVTPAPDGSAWITGSLAQPLSPSTADLGAGDSFVLHVAADQIDHLLRIGGSPTNNLPYAALNTVSAAPVVSPDYQTVTVPGTLNGQTDPSLRATQTFDLALNSGSSTVVPAGLADLLPASCIESEGCSGSAGLLTQLTLTSASASLSLSTGGLPGLLLRNPSTTPVQGLQLTAGASTVASDCGQTLAPFAQCDILLTSPGPGTLTATSSNAPALAFSIPSSIGSAQPLAFDSPELDFGVVTTAASPVTRTVTISNLSSTTQTFGSAPDDVPSSAAYTLSEVGGTCAGPPGAHTLTANASCTVLIGLSASALSQNDGPVKAYWTFGSRDVAITGFAQTAALTLSSSEIDFGPQTAAPSARLPRYLFLSNHASSAIAHTTASLPADSPFSLLDECPSALPANTVCRITLTYNQTTAPVFDSATLTLDQGLSVLLTGETLSTIPGGVDLAPSPLLVSPAAVSFQSTVPVSGLSSEIQTVQITNPAQVAVPLSTSVLGDFLLTNHCGATVSPGQTCALDLSFAPTKPGAREGVLNLSAGSGFQASTVLISGNASPILADDNGTLNLGQTVVEEPTVGWFQIQGVFPEIAATITGPGLTLALLADVGNGHGTLPPSSFAPVAHGACIHCWLAIRFLPQSPGPIHGTVQLSSGTAGDSYQLSVTAIAVPASGLVLAPAQQSFGAVAVSSTSAPVSFVLTNLLPDSTPTIIRQVTLQGDFVLAAASSSGCAGALEPTASCSVAVAFAPTAEGSRSGTLTVTTDAGNVTVALAGIGIAASGAPIISPAGPAPVFTIFPTQADFGAQPVGSLSQIRRFTLTNTSSTPQQLSVAPTRNFPLAESSPCPTLAPGASCNVDVDFAPETGGSLSGSLTATAASPRMGTTQTVLYLNGYGAGTGDLTAENGTDPLSPVSFGDVPSGASALQTILLTNAGDAPLHIQRLTSTTPFQTGSSCTASLPPGGTCSVTVTYAPIHQLPGTATLAPRTDSGTLTIEADSANSPLTIYLAGTALAARAGTNLTPQTSLPTYTLSQSALTFPNTQPGTSAAAQTITVANTGSVPVTFAGLLAPADFPASTTCTVLPPEASCFLSVAFRPAASSSNSFLETLEIVSDAGDPLESISLLGSSVATPLQFSPAALRFGSVPLGNASSLTGTLTNTTDLPQALGILSATGDFSLNSGTCPQAAGGSLAAGESCSFPVSFTPSAPGTRTGAVTLSPTETTNSFSLPLTGIGIAPQLGAAPTAIDFGSVRLTTISDTLALSLTNMGTAPLNRLALTLSGNDAADFTYVSGCSSDGLAIGASCTVQIAFTPSTLGTRSASLTVNSAGLVSPLLVPLTGTGTQPPGFALSVNGSATAAASIASGDSASFPLTLTPKGGYAGPVALTCTPIAPAPDALCALASPEMTLVSGPATSAATISTLSGIGGALIAPLSLFLLVGPRSSPRSRLRASRLHRLVQLELCLALAAVSAAWGCGSGPATAGHPYTPAGTYQYQVTATSTSGPALSSSVTLSVIVH